nr:troponin i [Hymenolepis microstoma]
MSGRYEDDSINSRSSQSDDQILELRHKPQNHPKNDNDVKECISSSGDQELMASSDSLSSGHGRTERRLSSLDVYLLQPKDEPVSYVLHRRETLKDVIEEEAERRQLASDQKRAEVMMARMQKNDDKRRESVLRDLTQAQMERTRSQSLVRKFGGLTPEKRKRLKELLMQKAKEEFRNEQKELVEAKQNYLQKVCPPINIDNMDDAQLVTLIKDLYARVQSCQKEKQEMQERLQMQSEERYKTPQGLLFGINLTAVPGGEKAVGNFKSQSIKIDSKDKESTLVSASPTQNNHTYCSLSSALFSALALEPGVSCLHSSH